MIILGFRIISDGDPITIKQIVNVKTITDKVTGKVTTKADGGTSTEKIFFNNYGGIQYQSLDAFNKYRNKSFTFTDADSRYYAMNGAIRQPQLPMLTSYANGWMDYTGSMKDISSQYALSSRQGPSSAPNSHDWILLRGTNYPNYSAESVAKMFHDSWSNYHTTFVVGYDNVYQVGHRNKVAYGFGQTANFKCPVQIAVCEYTDQWEQLRAYYHAIVLAKKWARYYKIPLEANSPQGICTADYVKTQVSDGAGSFDSVLSNAGLTECDFVRDVEYVPQEVEDNNLNMHNPYQYGNNSHLTTKETAANYGSTTSYTLSGVENLFLFYNKPSISNFSLAGCPDIYSNGKWYGDTAYRSEYNKLAYNFKQNDLLSAPKCLFWIDDLRGSTAQYNISYNSYSILTRHWSRDNWGIDGCTLNNPYGAFYKYGTPRVADSSANPMPQGQPSHSGNYQHNVVGLYSSLYNDTYSDDDHNYYVQYNS